MMTILNLFGRSPFAPLQAHMEIVAQCVHKVRDLFDILKHDDQAAIEALANEISELEHRADLIKNDIRNNLPKSLFLPINHSQLLEILTLQDSLADAAEDIAVLFTLKPLRSQESFFPELIAFTNKNIEAFECAHSVIKELHELLESSFGGTEASKVKGMVDKVAYKEHEIDLLQRDLLKNFFQSEETLSYSSFFLWQKIIGAIAALSNLSEKLAYRVRTTLDIKSS